jgi:hypothetical protein
MATYNGVLRQLSHVTGAWDYALMGLISSVSAIFADAPKNIPSPGVDFELGGVGSYTVDTKPIFNSRLSVINRGRNTGGGPAYVYWYSPDVPDLSGAYYNLHELVPWSQVTDVIWASTTSLRTTWPPTTA